ncbi:MAG: cytochrome c3 family protein [Deltaproteobacteria bacterium]|nr:cytochrome c3 family protein [Deltaproteobacteria bacterium]
MWNKRSAWLVAVLFSLGSFLGVALATEVPKDKAEIKLDLIKGKKGAVKFAHAKHASEFKDAKGGAIGCKTCHHTEKGEPKSAKDIKGCGDCHVADGQPQKEFGGKKAPVLATAKGDDFDKGTVVFHKTCLDCHKAVAKANPQKAGIDKCKACHGK